MTVHTLSLSMSPFVLADGEIDADEIPTVIVLRDGLSIDSVPLPLPDTRRPLPAPVRTHTPSLPPRAQEPARPSLWSCVVATVRQDLRALRADLASLGDGLDLAGLAVGALAVLSTLAPLLR